jgi:hypothetical protein
MLIPWVVTVPAENCDGIWNIGPSGGHRVHKASEHQLENGRITGFFVRLPLMKRHRHWRGNSTGVIHSEPRQDRPNVAVLLDVDHVMLSIEFAVYAEIDGDTPEIIHLESLPHLVRDLLKEAVVNNDEKLIEIQKDCGNEDVLILVVEDEQSSVEM